ncbi:MAG TPA: DinB family protein [Candidatus Acidoferrales bacterium]|nr:DinB family protein [Candidatus Acidoferrales bacterium]
MEITSVKSFLDYYERVRERTKRLMEVIRPEHLDFAYMPGKFTVGDEIRHIATIERYMFAETVAGRRSAYQGCGRQLADGYENILKYFDDLHRESLDIFRSLSDEDLKRRCTTPGDVQMAIWKWLRVMVEHEIHHRAQLYIYLNLLKVKTPPIFGLTAEEIQERSVKNPA